MRLPASDELQDDDERFLWKHDVAQFDAAEAETPYWTAYRYRLGVVVELVDRWAPAGVVLDAACAQGNVAVTLGAAGRLAVGVDLRHSFLSYAQKRDDQVVAHWITGSLEALPVRPRSIGCIVLGEVLEHVAHPERLLHQATSVLEPLGIVIATTPNGDRFHTGLPNLGAITSRADLEGRQFQPDADGHLFLLTRSELVLIGTSVGLELVEHRYIQTPFITGWPFVGAHIDRVPMRIRQRLNKTGEAIRLSRFLNAGQVAVFRKP